MIYNIFIVFTIPWFIMLFSFKKIAHIYKHLCSGKSNNLSDLFFYLQIKQFSFLIHHLFISFSKDLSSPIYAQSTQK